MYPVLISDSQITTDQPIFDDTFDYGSYAITGKMRTYNLDGTAYCMDDYLSEGIDTDDYGSQY